MSERIISRNRFNGVPLGALIAASQIVGEQVQPVLLDESFPRIDDTQIQQARAAQIERTMQLQKRLALPRG